MKRSLQQIAEAVDARLQGDGSVEVAGVASIGSASQHDLVFVEEEKYLLRALQSGAGAVIAGEFAAGKLARLVQRGNGRETAAHQPSSQAGFCAGGAVSAGGESRRD